MPPKKRLKHYIILCAFCLLIYLGIFISGNIDFGPYALEGVGALIYAVYVLPIASIIYGIVSYKITKHVFSSNLIVYFFSSLFGAIFLFINDLSTILDSERSLFLYFMDALRGSLVLFAILPTISIAVSAIAKMLEWIMNKNKKRSEPEVDNDMIVFSRTDKDL